MKRCYNTRVAPLARGVCALFVLALLLPAAAGAYSWPLRPFYKAHVIRGYFNDPRKVGATTSFHFGVDIVAADHEPVYAVEAGRARVRTTSVSVIARGRTLSYWHIHPAVRNGQHVSFHQVVGYIEPGMEHLHLAEFRNGSYINPLRIGGLAPFIDDVVPRVPTITFYLDGRPIPVAEVRGIVDLTTDAHDLPPLPLPPPEWAQTRLAPALIRWRIVQGHAQIRPWQTSVDFRTFLIPSTLFTFVYAPGTYQNRPNRPGRYEYYLARNFDTRTLPNGLYNVEVEAWDTQENIGRASYAFLIRN
jgi:murein DD-endopeptidase MepM/ murein hydrolase activator NlpD